MSKETKEQRKERIAVVGFEVSKSTKEQIKDAAKDRNMTISALCRAAVREYLAKS